MDLGDIIYLAFVVISVLLGVFGKKKKKGTQEDKAPMNDFSLEDFLKNAYGQQEEQEPTSVVSEQNLEEEAVDIPPRDFTDHKKSESKRKSLYEEIKRKNAEAAKLKKKLSKKSPIYSDEISEAQQEDAFVFDARKAIIYSEIMKRPEY